MEFSRLEIKPRIKPKSHINYQPICSCCQDRPVAGYVVGSGQYLTNTCLKCYRAAGIEAKERTSLKVIRSDRKARS